MTTPTEAPTLTAAAIAAQRVTLQERRQALTDALGDLHRRRASAAADVVLGIKGAQDALAEQNRALGAAAQEIADLAAALAELDRRHTLQVEVERQQDRAAKLAAYCAVAAQRADLYAEFEAALGQLGDVIGRLLMLVPAFDTAAHDAGQQRSAMQLVLADRLLGALDAAGLAPGDVYNGRASRIPLAR